MSTALIAATLAGACSAEPWPEATAVVEADFRAEHAAWQQNRRNALVRPPGGAVLWMGLWDLPQGASPLGSGEGLAIRLPEIDSPALAGTLFRDGQAVFLEPEPGAMIQLVEQVETDDGVEQLQYSPVQGRIALGDDRSGATTRLLVGSLGLRIHAEPGTDRLWLRAWDEDAPERETFELPDYFPVDPAWRLAARFDAYDEPRPLRIPDVKGGSVEYQAQGELVFQRDGREQALIATGSATSTSLFVMLWDSTAVHDTYQAGRYLRVPLPDETGWTTIDFNRTYNAPCVFTAYSVCALPPKENWLGMHVTAGEKRPDKGAATQ